MTPGKTTKTGGAGPALPYTLMYASGLKIGLSSADMLGMPFGRLANILASMAPPRDDGAREATQEDIAMLA